MRVCVFVYGLLTVLSLAQSVHCPPPPPPFPKTKGGGHRVACASAETVQCLRSQNSQIIDANAQKILTAGIRRLIQILVRCLLYNHGSPRRFEEKRRSMRKSLLGWPFYKSLTLKSWKKQSDESPLKDKFLSYWWQFCPIILVLFCIVIK